jgi:F-type H+-transporting ATPase subunit c
MGRRAQHAPRATGGPVNEPPNAAAPKESDTMNQFSLGYFAAGIGAGLAVIGAGLGIGKLAAAAMEGSARQPTAAGDIRTSMIIAAALIEGATLFAIVVTLLLAIAK